MLNLLLKVRMQAWLAYLSGSGRNGAFRNKSGKGKIVLFAFLYLYLIVVFVGMFFAMFSMLAPVFYDMGLGWFYFCLFLMVAFALMFVFSVFTAKSQLFEARDNELLLSMPIPPTAVLGSRMASLLLTNFGFELVVAAPAAVAAGETAVNSPMPGNVFKVECQVGQSVQAGDILVVLEAMKMEIEVSAPCAGTVKAIAANVGATVNTDDLLVTLG